MTYVCMYFQVHQPRRLKKYSYFDVGHHSDYYDDEKNKEILLKIAHKCYLPTNQLLLKLIKQHKNNFRISYSITGTAIEQLKEYSPQTLDSFKALVDTGCVEILSETYSHTLSSIFSKSAFLDEIEQHRHLINTEFSVNPVSFRNTELIYNNDIGKLIESLGYKAILAEGFEKILEWRSPNYLYHSKGCKKLKLLLRNYRLSDDIAFRFSNQSTPHYPLTADKFSHWIHDLHGQGDIINLFMDYETFGEHQWADTGIFEFLEALPGEILKHPEFMFCTPSEAAKLLPAKGTLDISDYFSWADIERDLTAWRGNHLQEDAFSSIYVLEKQVQQSNNPQLKKIWQSLLTSDHFYYMCTKWSSDGDVHKYFSPYQDPYSAFINYQNVVKDFKRRLDE